MKTFTLPQQEIRQCVENLNRVINPKSPIPVLDNLHCQLHEDGNLIMTAKGEGVYMTGRLTTDCLGENATFGIDHKIMGNILKELSEQPLTFSIDGMKCVVNYHNGHFDVPFQDMTDYPTIPTMDNTKSFTIESNVLKNAIAGAGSFTIVDELRPVMNAICVDLLSDKAQACLVGSDGHTLAKITVPCTVKQNERLLIPTETAKIIEKILVHAKDEVTIEYNDKMIHVECGIYNLYIRMLNGRYPNYNSILPANMYPTYLDVDRNALMAAVRRVGVCSDMNMLLKFTVDGYNLTLAGEDYDFSTGASETIFVDGKNKAIVIGLKGTLVQRILTACKSEQVRIYYDDPSRLVIYCPLNGAEPDTSQLYIQMPMMIG